MIASGDLGAEARAAWAIARRELRIFARYRLNAVNQVAQPLYQTLIPGLLLGATFAVGGQVVGLADTAGTTDLAGYLFLGMLSLNLTAAGFWNVAYALKLELDAGTLEPAWLTPTRPETYVIGLTLSAVLLAIVSTAILVAVGVLIFGAGIAPRLLLAVPVLAIATLGVLGIGYLVGALVLRLREATFFVDAIDFTVIVLSGAAFPIVVLPDALRWLAYSLPTTWALDLIRIQALGTRPLMPVAVEWLLLVTTSLALLVIGRWTWLVTERRLRVRGTLGQH